MTRISFAGVPSAAYGRPFLAKAGLFVWYNALYVITGDVLQT